MRLICWLCTLVLLAMPLQSCEAQAPDTVYVWQDSAKFSKAWKLTGLFTTPNDVTLVPGKTVAYKATATWNGNRSTVPPITWSASGGTITSAGLYTAGQVSGSYRVIAAAMGLADTNRVIIVPPLADVLPGRVTVGPWGAPPVDSLVPTPFSGIMLTGMVGYTALPRVQARGGVAVLNLPRNAMRTRSPNLISVAMAKAYLDGLPDLTPYVRDGTLWGFMVADDITGTDIWGPNAPYLAQIDTIGKYVQDKWGARPVIRSAPTVIGKYPYKLQWVKWTWSQYHSRYGGVAAWRDAEMAKAKATALCNVFGLNALNGGDGSSGVTSTVNNSGQMEYEMSPAEILADAKLLVPYTQVFMHYEYIPATYLRQKDAWVKVRQMADTTSAPACV